MKIVEINVFNYDDFPVSKHVVCTVKLVRNQVRFMGKYGKSYKRNLQENGIYLNNDGEHKYLYPKDGLEFMEALSTHYRGSKVRASDVITQPD